MLTVLEVIKKTTDFFAAKGIESPRLNAELLVGHALGLKRMQLYLQFERPLTPPELEALRALVRRRGLREPVQYVIGETEFAGLKLKVDKRALIPRPETERLVELITELLSTPPARVLDLGTGSGAIALALARHYPEAQVLAVDRSEDALALARENGAAGGETFSTRVTFLNSDWFARIPADAKFDLIVANPPYLTEEETAQAAAEVREHEPLSALTAGDRGLADLRTILAAARTFLAPGGMVALETGIAHHEELKAIAVGAGFEKTESHPDLTGRDRYFIAR